MNAPILVDLPVGTHHICTCGQSRNQSFCDGSHQGTEHLPRLVALREPVKQAAICRCGKSRNLPFCDGGHKG